MKTVGMKTVGQKIKDYLKEHDITQTELAIDTKMSLPKLNLALSGKRKLQLEEFEIICGVLGVNADTFLTPRLPERGNYAKEAASAVLGRGQLIRGV